VLAAPAGASVPTISLVAGNGTAGYNGDGIPAASAELNLPRALTVDAAGDVFVADTFNHRIRRIDPGGVITTVAGNGVAGSTGDGGPATAAEIKWPHSVAVDRAGDVYLTDSPNHRIRKVDHATGIITTVAGTGTAGYNGDGIPATSARIDDPKGVMVDDDGQGHVTVYIADSLNQRVRKVTPDGIIHTIAGTGAQGYNGDGIPATRASLYRPRGMALDAAGNVYIADDDNHRVRRIDPNGVITTIAGTGVAGYNGDGIPATQAQLNNPRTLALDPAGFLYIADGTNSRVRRVDLAGGVITTVAGTGVNGYSGDGGAATSAELAAARGVGLGPDGTLYIADTFNSRLRKVVGLSAPPVTPVDQPPAATAVTVSTPAGTAVPVTLSGRDPEDCELTFSIVTPPAHGTLSALSDQPCSPGSPNTDRATVTYTPAGGYGGPDSFTYRAADTGGASDPAAVSVTVGAPAGPPAGITFRSASSARNTTARTLTVPTPAGTTAGDVMVAAVAVRGSAAITPPAGWTLLRTDKAGTSTEQALFSRVAGSGEPPSSTWSFSASVPAAGGIFDYRGVSSVTPIGPAAGQGTTSTTASIVAPSITTTVPGALVIGMFTIGGANSVTPPAGMTEHGEAASTAGSNHVTWEGCDFTPAAAGATGTKTATASTAHPNVGALLALNPA
jgi:sugar lactone lactonase YvrE